MLRRKTALDEKLRAVGYRIGKLSGKSLDLADVVGGGDGFGSGKKGLGIDVRTGAIQERKFGNLGNVQPGKFAKSRYPFVDGIFVPAAGKTQISTTKLFATGLPKNGGKAWDMIRNGPVSSQFSTEWGGVDYTGEGHSMIGLHANAGITFDVAAVRKATGFGALEFSTVVGYGGRTVEPNAEFRVLLDGKLQASKMIGRRDAVAVSFRIPVSARFLTLISTDGGNDYGNDQISFGDPKLAPVDPQDSTDGAKQELTRLRSERDRIQSEIAGLGELPVFFGVVPASETGELPVVHVLDRGNPEAPGKAVEPGTIAWAGLPVGCGDANTPEGERRAALANWIVDPANPLTRRVMVNRLWHWHFGQGIVDTPSDFGLGGGRPSHPELLDWLAAKLLEEKWSLKAIHRLIVTSATYRQSSLPRADAEKIDADNRLLWRMNSRRLEAEAVRDAVLAVSGKLNLEMHGPGFRDFKYTEAYAPIYEYVTADSPELWRRSVYRFLVRTTPQPFMTTMDCPDPASLTPKRNVTTTALQSLALFNNEFMLKQAGYFSDRVRGEVGENGVEQVDRVFQIAFGRQPNEGEKRDAEKLVTESKEGLFHLCRAILNANEFVYVD